MSALKPMLAAEYDPDKLTYPLHASPKIDGVRATVQGGQFLSRSLKLIPNEYIQSLCSHDLEGLDGELYVGNGTDFNLMQQTTSGVMSRKGEPHFTYMVFDLINQPEFSHRERIILLHKKVSLLRTMYPFLRMINMSEVHSRQQLDKLHEEYAQQGYEGLMLAKPSGLYKHGRSTVNQGLSLKVKLFEESEAEVLEVIQQFRNDNEPTKDRLGNTVRSSHKENKVPLPMMGALKVRDIHTGCVFNIGTGFSDHIRRDVWKNGPPNNYLVKYRHFPKGVVDKPRIPSFVAFRHISDM